MSQESDQTFTSDDAGEQARRLPRSSIGPMRFRATTPGHYGASDVQPSKHQSQPHKPYVYRAKWPGGGWSIQPAPYQSDPDRRGAFHH